jgi:hypothetical protein
MPYCPNCGRYVSHGDSSCPECNCSLDGGGNDASGPRHDSSTGNAQRSEPGQGVAASRRDQRESRRGESGSRPSGARARTERNADVQTGKTRRTALAWAGGALGLTVLGTWILGLVDDEGPKDAIEAWRSAWHSGDNEAYREFWHSESPRWTDRTDDEQSRFLTVDASLRYVSESRKTIEQTDTRASVRDVYLLVGAEFETPRRITDVVDLRTENGNWRIWDYRRESSEKATNCRQNVTITGSGSIQCE